MDLVNGGREECAERRTEVGCFLVVLSATILISLCVGRSTKQRTIIFLALQLMKHAKGCKMGLLCGEK